LFKGKSNFPLNKRKKKSPSNKIKRAQNRENPVTQSHGSKAELSQDSQTADKSKTAKRRRRKVRRLKPTQLRGQD
jgi:hypothetical protein